MDIIEMRRENLRRWVAKYGTPAKEKSLFSQLKSNGSFGEKVARRLEEQYKMGNGYLDSEGQEDQPQPAANEAEVAHEETANEFLVRLTEMLETYRLAGPVDRDRIDLAFSDARENLAGRNQVKPRAR